MVDQPETPDPADGPGPVAPELDDRLGEEPEYWDEPWPTAGAPGAPGAHVARHLAEVPQADDDLDAADDARPEDTRDDEPAVPEPEWSLETTGNTEVDAVLVSLAGLGGKHVHEHVAVFEAAHDRLRRALADPAEG